MLKTTRARASLVFAGILLATSGLAQDATLRANPGHPSVASIRVCEGDCSSGLEGIGWHVRGDNLLTVLRFDQSAEALPLTRFDWFAQAGPLMATGGTGMWQGASAPGSVYFHGGDGFLHYFQFHAPSGDSAGDGGTSNEVRWGARLNRPLAMAATEAPGITGWLHQSKALVVDGAGAAVLVDPGDTYLLEHDGWLAFADRFFVFALSVPAGTDVQTENGSQEDAVSGMQARFAAGALQAPLLYAGTQANAFLQRADQELLAVRFPRSPLSTGFHWVLEQLYQALGSVVAAILMMALLISLLLWPVAHALSKPSAGTALRVTGGVLLAALRVVLLLAASLAVAVFFPTRGTSFFWITDLAQPDLVALLPFSVPGVGNGLYALPFVFLGIYWVSLRAMGNARIRLGTRPVSGALGLVSGLVAFAAIYTAPASVVLYWTTLALLAGAKAVLTRPGTSTNPQPITPSTMKPIR